MNPFFRRPNQHNPGSRRKAAAMRPLAIALWLGGAPAIAFAVLAIAGWSYVLPALVGIAVSIAAAAAFALVWARDLDLLTNSVRRVAADEPGPVPEAAAAVLMDVWGGRSNGCPAASPAHCAAGTATAAPTP